jgi:hypothetical protein
VVVDGQHTFIGIRSVGSIGRQTSSGGSDGYGFSKPMPKARHDPISRCAPSRAPRSP